MKKSNKLLFSGILLTAFVIFAALVLSGQIMWFSETPPLMVISDMDDQFKVKPQVGSTFFADRKANRDIIENTVPRDGSVYPFAMGDVDKAEAAFASGNPVPSSEYILARGQNRFHTYCSPCHNYKGTGDGLVGKKGFGSQETMNLTKETTKAFTDAHIFHIISAGQNIMPAYGDRISVTDRWAIVHYVRELQGNPTVAPAVAPPPAIDSVNTPTSDNTRNASIRH